MKTILVPTESHESMRSALATALMLARRFDSYIEGFALRFRINEFVAVDMAGAIPLETLREESLDEARRARALFEAFMRERGVPRSDAPAASLSSPAASLSYGWFDDAPEGEDFVGSRGRVFDVIVMSRSEANSIGLHDRAIESGLFDSGRPILIAAQTPPQEIGANVLIAWNCSTEQARTTAFAMPLLRKAERITVLHVEGGAAVPGPSAAQATQYLQRNGLNAGLMTVGLEGRSTGEAILAAAQSLGCDLLIKGAYTQSRLRQMIFGGATRHILKHATLPVLMAN
ncbi:MAG TPA: universal stress protein [Xanthobacteraceae bacterium]|jgi:nucleotide-binding universal stress UspA family protein|nr:universal stress protein [Xanthobacteraceae bacterium]